MPLEQVIDRPGLRAVVAGCCAGLALAAAAIGWSFAHANSVPTVDGLSMALVVAVFAVTGLVLVLAVPANRVGWLVLATAAVLGVGTALTEAGVHGVLVAPGSVPGAAALAAVGPGLRAAGWVMAVVAVPLFFPDGRLPGPRWRWLAPLVAMAVAGVVVGSVLSPTTQETRLSGWHNPYGLQGGWGALADGLGLAAVLLSAVGLVGAVAGLVSRWRRRRPVVRVQVLLFATAGCAQLVVLAAALVTNDAPPWAFAVALLPLPVAIGVAILSPGLYDLRQAAHRTLLWLTMSAVVLATYAVAVFASAALVPDHRSWWPAALAAGLASLVLVPVLRLLQRGVSRLVFGRAQEPYAVLAELGDRLADAADADRLLRDVAVELAATLGLQDVAVRDSAGTVVAGTAPRDPVAVGIDAFGGSVGQLEYRRPEQPLSPAEQRLLRDVTHQLGGALLARELRGDLQRARERLVAAREEERRRLRRDLHDGIGPALAGLTLKAETAAALLPPGTAAAARQIDALAEQSRALLVEVRRIVTGLRPPALDELGLLDALTQTAEVLASGAGIGLSVHGEGDLVGLPAAVEVAAYRIGVEAVTNVVRHAGAGRCEVTLTLSGGAMTLTCLDDGTGLDAGPAAGHGLSIMRERAEELGGDLSVELGSPGVRVVAHIPVPLEASPTPSTNAVPA